MGITAKYDSVVEEGWTGKVFCDESALDIPLKRKKPTMYFVPSMGDLFHKDVPFDFIDKVMAAMVLCPQHTFQVLTKRPERMAKYMERAYEGIELQLMDGGYPVFTWPAKNLWLGTSCSNQKDADENIPHLLKTPAAVRFLSLEPLLGRIDLKRLDIGVCLNALNGQSMHHILNGYGWIDWVIIGAESKGSHPGRECKIEWVRDIVRQCRAAGVAVFVKQLHMWKYKGELHEQPDPDLFIGSEQKCVLVKEMEDFPEDLRIREYPKIVKGE
jgi:protein gp37